MRRRNETEVGGEGKREDPLSFMRMGPTWIKGPMVAQGHLKIRNNLRPICYFATT